MKQTMSNCNPTILNKDTLMSDDGIFMNKELIRENCNCINKNTCLSLVDLLDNNKYDLASKLIQGMKKSQ